jgi:hypothetical protein
MIKTMNPSTQHLLSGFNCNGPAGVEEIRKTETGLGVVLPKEYIEFLLHANGGEGVIGDNAYLVLWRVEDLPEINAGYQVQIYAPGFVMFGSDGGGEAFAFDMRSQVKGIVMLPFVGMAVDEIQHVAHNFWHFLEQLRVGAHK